MSDSWEWEQSDEEDDTFGITKMELSNTELQFTPTPGNNCICDPALQRIEKTLFDLTKKVNTLQAKNVGQVELLMAKLSKRAALLKNIKREHIGKPKSKKFPIPSVAALEKMNKEITNGNRDQYLEAIRSIIRTGGVVKDLRNVLSTEVVMQCNINGLNGKAGLKDYTQFFEVLIEAIDLEIGCGRLESLAQLRKALQLQKNRWYKTVQNKKSK